MTIALWTILVAAFLPLVFTGIAKFSKGATRFDNRQPRVFQANLDGFRARAHWAHLNSIEAFPPFAAAVLVAHVLHAPQDKADLLAVAFIVLRLVYGAMYLANQATLRSVAWALGVACVVGLFVISA
ncbi:MAPEG family protein [Tahibacter amnicola]|uniref:MAPEG family protein n=1 Tax=Tahibacter amnicola TaxID=2976241 RepID=A0ABY6BFV0_9GAMM|nr:MAPEG family protein [Tahibacter amnicola]UXI68744.1 MAPEG family protein [Tahibacter amnicola]